MKEGVFDSEKSMLEVQWDGSSVLDLKVLDKSQHRFIEHAEDILITEACRGRKYIYIIFQYSITETCGTLHSVNLKIVAEIPKIS